ncbi:MAG: hypothetical protein AMXMBFR64_13420 [Myxococcales bacterium]
MIELRTGDEATRWLTGRVKKLEQRVREAPELVRLLESSTEVLADLDSDPELLARDGVERLRRHAAQVGRVTADRVEVDGFRLDALDRWAYGMMVDDRETATQVLTAMADALRERMGALGTDGAERHGGAQGAFADLVARIGLSVRSATERWATKGPGKQQRSLLPWRRKAARRARPADDPVWLAEVTGTARRLRGELEASLRQAGEAAVSLTLARSYGAVATHLSELAVLGERLGELAPLIAGRAERALATLRGEGGSGRTADASMTDDASLDPVLARLDVGPLDFLEQAGDLSGVSERALEQSVRDFVASRLAGLGVPTLAEALGGMAGDRTVARRRLVDILLRGQPLVAFDDAVATRFPGGSAAHHLVLVETSDETIRGLVQEACAEAGLPAPRFERAPVGDDQLSLRIIQLVAGLPFFAQVERLSGMIRTHRETMSGADGARVGDASLVSALRDLMGSDRLADILPEELVAAALRRRAFDPLDDATAQEDPDGGDRGGLVTPFPTSGAKARA